MGNVAIRRPRPRTCFDYALDAISRLPDTDEWRLLDVQLRIAANGASMMIGNYEGGWPYLRHAEHVAKTLSDPRWEARVAIAASSCVRAAGKIDQALTFGRRALKIAEESREHSLQATAKFVLGLAEHNVGNFRRALEHLEPLMNETDPEWNETFLERPQNVSTIARYWTVFCCVQLGEFDRAGRLVEDGLRLLDVQTDVFQTQALYLHITHGRLLNAIGQFEAAVRAYEAGFAVYREDCHGNFYYALAWGRGLAYALAGRVNESLEQFQKAEAVAVRRGTRPFTAMWLLHFGRALLNAGRVDDAAQMARDAFTTNSKNGKRPSEAAALGLLADVAMRREPLPASEIEELLLKALTLAEPLEMRPLAARCHLRLASLYARLGRADADHHRAVAESLLDQMGRPRSLEAAGVH